jgi:hypothetical protein
MMATNQRTLRTTVTNGVLSNVYHFDGKATVDEYIKSIGLPYSLFLAGFYMSNFSGGMMFRRDPQDGAFTLKLPVPESTPAPLIDTCADTGKWIRGIVKSGRTGHRVLGATKYYTLADVLATFRKVYPHEGAKAKYVQVGHEEYSKQWEADGMPAFVGLEMMENLRLLDEFGYYGGESLDESVALAGGPDALTSLEEHFRKAPQFQGLS